MLQYSISSLEKFFESVVLIVKVPRDQMCYNFSRQSIQRMEKGLESKKKADEKHKDKKRKIAKHQEKKSKACHTPLIKQTQRLKV